MMIGIQSSLAFLVLATGSVALPAPMLLRRQGVLQAFSYRARAIQMMSEDDRAQVPRDLDEVCAALENLFCRQRTLT